MVLTGAGEKAFCTGFDRNTIPFDVPWDPYTYDDPGLSIGPRVNRLWKPVIAAVNGTAAAGAFYLLGQVDFIIAAEHATFVDPHVTYSMPAVYEPIEALAKMPFGEAMRISLLGASERMSARRAYEIGFVSEVVPSEELMDAATWAAEAIAAQPPAAIMATLRTLWAARELFPAQATALGNMFLHLGVDQEKTVLQRGRGEVRLPAAHQAADQVVACDAASVSISSWTSLIVSIPPAGTMVSSGIVNPGCASSMAMNSAMVRPRSADRIRFL